MGGSVDFSRVPLMNLLVVEFGLRPEAVFLGILCALLGAVFLSRYTRPLGLLTYPLNFIVLLTGAMLANWLTKDIQLPLRQADEWPLLISLAGMAVAALLMLLLMPRDRWRR